MAEPFYTKWNYAVDPTGDGFFWPDSDQKRRDYFAIKMLRPVEAQAVYQCNPGAKAGTIFIEADFRYFEAPIGLELGRSSPIINQWVDRHGGVIIQGWDTAMSATSKSDHSACATILLLPCESYHRAEQTEDKLGPCPQHFDVLVLEVFRAKLEIGDLIVAIREKYLQWRPLHVVIEKRASGASAMQALANTGIPLEGVTAQENKRDRAVNGGAGAGSVQGWFRAGRILFPVLPPPLEMDWLPGFIRELKDFTGEKGATDDQVDAFVHAVSWGIREGSSIINFPEGWRTPEGVDQHMLSPDKNEVLRQLSNPVEQLLEDGLIFDPFGDRCGRCLNFEKNFCKFHKRPINAICAACDAFDNGTKVLSIPIY